MDKKRKTDKGGESLRESLKERESNKHAKIALERPESNLNLTMEI